MTEPSWVQLIIPAASGLLGVAIGSIGNLLSQAQSDRRADDRASRARSDDAAAQVRAEQRAFELETFARLPKLVQAYGRTTGKVLLFDDRTLREHKRFASNSPGDQGAFDLNVELMLISSQILDDGVRAAVEAARLEMTAMQVPPSDFQRRTPEELIAITERRMQRLGELLGDTLERVNAYRRTLYSAANVAGQSAR